MIFRPLPRGRSDRFGVAPGVHGRDRGGSRQRAVAREPRGPPHRRSAVGPVAATVLVLLVLGALVATRVSYRWFDAILLFDPDTRPVLPVAVRVAAVAPAIPGTGRRGPTRPRAGGRSRTRAGGAGLYLVDPTSRPTPTVEDRSRRPLRPKNGSAGCARAAANAARTLTGDPGGTESLGGQQRVPSTRRQETPARAEGTDPAGRAAGLAYRPRERVTEAPGHPAVFDGDGDGWRSTCCTSAGSTGSTQRGSATATRNSRRGQHVGRGECRARERSDGHDENLPHPGRGAQVRRHRRCRRRGSAHLPRPSGSAARWARQTVHRSRNRARRVVAVRGAGDRIPGTTPSRDRSHMPLCDRPSLPVTPARSSTNVTRQPVQRDVHEHLVEGAVEETWRRRTPPGAGRPWPGRPRGHRVLLGDADVVDPVRETGRRTGRPVGCSMAAVTATTSGRSQRWRASSSPSTSVHEDADLPGGRARADRVHTVHVVGLGRPGIRGPLAGDAVHDDRGARTWRPCAGRPPRPRCRARRPARCRPGRASRRADQQGYRAAQRGQVGADRRRSARRSGRCR
jgi:hypothetical protein